MKHRFFQGDFAAPAASDFLNDEKVTNGPGHLPPLEGEGFRATARVAPTAENGPEALARQSQAQKWNRISPYFPPTQAPSGAGRNRTQALLILRAGRILPASRGNPRK